ncbi:endochitinase At2g43610-like [Humulus lupulus]|uniref:endochitinase At2g43610-like n=1 Tax=Humulus lupulus TaxID=3486 RepID=UPI002B40D37B|nr:endochitinase At2g43610-like [Humulus lupulus]
MRIEEESRSRDKNVEKYNGETSKANVVAKPPNNNKGKEIGKPKGKDCKPLGPKKNEGQFKSPKGPCFVCGENDHFARDCRFKKSHNNEPKVNLTEEELVVTLSEINSIHEKFNTKIYKPKTKQNTRKRSDSSHACNPNKRRNGRVPLQLTWNYTYEAAGKANNFDRLNSSKTVAIVPVILYSVAMVPDGECK